MKHIPYSLPCLNCMQYKPGLVKLPCYIQPKLQGIRARYWRNTRSFYSRDNHKWNDNVVKHITNEIDSVLDSLPEDIMLDGEFYCHGRPQGWHTSNINVNLVSPTDETLVVRFHLFDFWKQRDCPEDFGLRQMIIQKNHWPYSVATYYVTHFQALDSYHEIFKSQGFEGSVIIRPKCPYKEGKFPCKLKRKDFKDGEFTIVGMEKGSGKHLNRMGALVLETPDGGRFNVGTGFTDSQREKFWLLYEKLFDCKATIKYQELSEDGIPLITSFVSIRDYE